MDILQNWRLPKQEAVRDVLRGEERGDQMLHAARLAAVRPKRQWEQRLGQLCSAVGAASIRSRRRGSAAGR